jgi:hypothetical protein
MNNEEQDNSHKSQSTVRVVKSRGLIWAGHIAWTGKRENTTIFLQKGPPGRQRIRWRIKLK